MKTNFPLWRPRRWLSLSLVLGLGCGGVPGALDSASDGQDLAAQARGWTRVYRHDFKDLHDVNRFESGKKDNDDAADLRKPTLNANVEVVKDAAAEDGYAIATYTRQGTFQTSAGAKVGWSNGRWQIDGQDMAPPLRIRTRIRTTASIETKSAVMFWPSGGGWSWEVDFLETFGGSSLTQGSGARQTAGERWHFDKDGNGRATEQMIKDFPLDTTRYHVYDLLIGRQTMTLLVDGVAQAATTAAQQGMIPNGVGHFGIGKALTGARDVPGRTEDALYVDWLELYRR